MKAVVLTMAHAQKYDNHEDAFYRLSDQQAATVRKAIQESQLADDGILVVVDGYASIQSVGSGQTIILTEVIPSEASGNHPNTEWLSREVIYYDGRGVLGVRVVYTTTPMKRIVYDISADGDIQIAHV